MASLAGVLNFDNVDAGGLPQAQLDYLDRVEALAPAAAVRERTYALLPAGPGADVGCGRGRAVADLAERGHDGVGVDRSRVMVSAARRRFPALRFLAGDATDLPLKDACLHWYRSERTYLHIAEPLKALAEARRVLVPGGRAVIADLDCDSIVLSSPDAASTRAMVSAFTDSLANGRSGTRMASLMMQAGFTDVTVEQYCFSTTATVLPRWAARIAATYAPGPAPRTTTS